MCISLGASHTLLVEFLTPCSRPPRFAGCTSSPTCNVWWCAGDGPAPQTGWGPLRLQSWTHALSRRMFGCPHSSVYGSVLTRCLRLLPVWLMHVHAWALHSSLRNGVHNSFAFFDWDCFFSVPACGGESVEVGTLPWPPEGLGYIWLPQTAP